MLVSSNNDVSLRKAFEELSISSQVNCGFYNKNEKIKTSEPIETEWTDDKKYCPPIEYALRTRPIPSMADIADELNRYMPRFYDPHTIYYSEERDKDISSDEDEEENLRFKRFFGEGGVYWESETSCIDATEPPFALSEKVNALLSYLDDIIPDDYEGLKLCYK